MVTNIGKCRSGLNRGSLSATSLPTRDTCSSKPEVTAMLMVLEDDDDEIMPSEDDCVVEPDVVVNCC